MATWLGARGGDGAAFEADAGAGSGRRSGFVASAVLVAALVALGVVLGVRGPVHDEGEAAAPPGPGATSPPAAPGTSAAVVPGGGPSVCGLPGVVMTGGLATAPEVDWAYDGTTAYPTSPVYGPGRTAGGVRDCFQHSPAGAVLAAANAAATPAGDPERSAAWFSAFVADGAHRDEILAAAGAARGPRPGTRMAVSGFRLLDYGGDTARVDIAATVSVDGEQVLGSYVYDLQWQSGDWKLSAATPAPFDFAVIPDLAGYVGWGA